MERFGDCTLYLGDSLSVLDELGGADALITDPPYGVSGGSGTLGKASTKTKYSGSFEDTKEYVFGHVITIVQKALTVTKRAVITPGTPCMFMYPAPDDVGAIYQPATTGLNKWGRETTQPVLFYGKDPMSGKTIQPKHFQNTFKASDNEHPCAKPDKVMQWMVHRGSLPGETVLDPFMGSGTCGVASIRLGRKFIGIEIDAGYFDIACRRIEQELKQPMLFSENRRQENAILL